MIHKYIEGRSYDVITLSDEEEERVQQILEELRFIFNADLVMIEPEITASDKTNYAVKIINGDNIGFRIYRR